MRSENPVELDDSKTHKINKIILKKRNRRTNKKMTLSGRQFYSKPEKEDSSKKEETKEIYKGQKAYDDYAPLDKDRYVNKLLRPGPRPPPSNIRVTTYFDYKPDLCKDYKEAGYCGYGDSCKFVHDRTDYLTGWEIEKQWEKNTKVKQSANGNLNGDEEDEKFLIKEDQEQDLLCNICKDEFVSPVVTICGHKFCEKCALTNFKQSAKCAVCKTDTKGIFNAARKSSKPRRIPNSPETTDKADSVDFAKHNKGFGDESSWTYS